MAAITLCQLAHDLLDGESCIYVFILINFTIEIIS